MYSDTRRRKNSLRQPGHDYHRPGTVFVTIDTWWRQELFGDIVDGNLQPTLGGSMVIQRWREIPGQFPNVTLDAFVLMPDHLRGIVTTTADGRLLPSIGEIVRWFKSSTHASWRAGVNRHGWPPYEGRLWQPDYHDHVVRDADELARIRHYIAANPSRWLADKDDIPGSPWAPSPNSARPGENL